MFSLLIGLFFNELLENIFLNIQELSSFSTVNLKKIDSLIPLSFSFMSGMLATVNPCGFVMLPVYISMFLSILRNIIVPTILNKECYAKINGNIF